MTVSISMPAVGSTPKLKSNQIISLQMNSEVKVHGQYVLGQKGTWWIKLSKPDFLKLQFSEHLKINFAVDGNIYFATSLNSGLNKNKQILILSPPQVYDMRPLRAHERVVTRLETALIIPSTENSPRQFIRRFENRILNISLGGCQLACSKALSDNVSDVLLLMGLDQTKPLEKDSQIYCHGIIRRVKETDDSDYPYVYGISFKPMAPMFKYMLEGFIESADVTSDITSNYKIDKRA
ncbi:MAG TPA: hypothetical protein ENI05_15220 [Porticoccus sp.]|nr:hypothetical protein [Porticoccus sp.]